MGLAQMEEQAGHPAAAARWMRASLDVYPDDEACLRALLHVLDSIDDRAGALLEYEQFSRRIWAEYEARPSPETMALVEAIRSREARSVSAMQSLVVLPFENLSPGQGDHFSDGFVEEIISSLSSLPGLRVIARSSSARLKGTAKDIRTIGRELGVLNAVEGSLRREGDNLRVAARLIEVGTSSIIWSETYAGSLLDVFDIQERLTRAIVTKLAVGVGMRRTHDARSRHQGSIVAYDCYYRAARDIAEQTEEALNRAVRHVRNGLDLIGENPLLLSTLAYAYVLFVELGIRPEPRYLNQAEEHARRALRINPDQALGHAALGMVKYKRGDIEEAIVDLRRALDADPNQPEALLRLAIIYLIGGNETVAGPLLERLLAVDPLTPVNHAVPGYALLLQGNVEGAIPGYRRMYGMEPDSPLTRWFYSLVLIRCGRESEALALLDGVVRDTPGTTFARHAAFLRHALHGDRKMAVACATRELQDEARWDQHASWWMASTYALIDERDAAVDWLANAAKLGFINYPFLSRFDPCLEGLRADRRFWALMAQVKERWERFTARTAKHGVAV
jgi:non-specific serine/threonine protein kinase